MKSIIQEDKSYCYICNLETGRKDEVNGIEEHHIFSGSGNRHKSEEYGLKVYLCSEHHQFGPEAVHKRPNTGYDYYLKSMAQKLFEEKYPDKSFVVEFGRNYI